MAAVLIVATTGSLTAQQPTSSAAGLLPSRTTAAIQGEALDAANRTLPSAVVRLRDARRGRIVTQSITDTLGAYVFKGVDPGNYVVELVSKTQTTLAATSLISANAGETVTAVVKLPFSPSLLGTLLSNEAAPSVLGQSAPAALTVTEVPQALIRGIPALAPAGPPVTEQ